MAAMSKRRATATAVRRLVLEILGWALVLAGLAALVLPGPGMLMLFAGLAVLSGQYQWARRLLRPVKIQALLGAAEGVETMPRIVMSTLLALGVGGFGVLWVLQPPAPGWWPLAEKWWLFGGRTVGVTLLLSCAIALGLLVYSLRRFRGHPDEVEEVRAMARARKRAVRRLKQRRRTERAERRG